MVEALIIVRNAKVNMKKIIGITGGISCGKSSVTNIIKELGFTIIDCDKISYELTLKGNSIYNEILRVFGIDYLNNNQEIDRKKLGQLVFNNKDAKEKLNSISHPLIIEELKRQIGLNNGIIFLEIPLLFETKLEYLCDVIICVYVDKETQIIRLMNRDNIDREFAIKKINSQMDLSVKKALSDYVIYNDKELNNTKEQIINIIKEL